MYLAGLVLAGVLTGGCTRLEMLDYVSHGNDKAVKVRLELGHAEAMNEAGRIDTKSYLTAADIETRITDVTLAVYESDGTQAYIGYLTSGFGSVEMNLRSDETYNIYALANMGDQRSALASAISGGSLSSMTYTVDYSSMATDGIPMAKSMTGQSFSDGQTVTVYLQRLLAKINVSLSCAWAGAVITAATVKNVNPTVSPFGTSPAGSTNPATLQDIHGTVAGTASSMSAVFYVPENPQGTVGSVATSMQKTYTNEALSGVRDYATYLEVDVTTSGAYEGDVTYRSYLGANQTTDFNIERNEVYNWSITYYLGNLETYDWKRDNTDLYYYRLIHPDDGNGGMTYYNHFADPTFTHTRRFYLRKYNARTGSVVSTETVLPSSVRFYSSDSGTEQTDILDWEVYNSELIKIKAGSVHGVGQVFIEADYELPSGIVLTTTTRQPFYVNGVYAITFSQAQKNIVWSIAFGDYLHIMDQNNFIYQTYYNGEISYANTFPTGSSFSVSFTSVEGQTYTLQGLAYSPASGPYVSIQSSYVHTAFFPFNEPVEHTMTLAFRYNSQDNWPDGAVCESCLLRLYPRSWGSGNIVPDVKNMQIGDSFQFQYLLTFYSGMNNTGTIDYTSNYYTSWTIESSTGGLTGLSLTTSTGGGLFSVGAGASEGTVVIRATNTNIVFQNSGTATIIIGSGGGGSSGGIDDDWEDDGETEL